MKRAITRLGLATAAGLALAGSAGAQPLAVPPGRWWEKPRVAMELGLTVEQRRQLDTDALAHAKTMVDLKGGVEKAELDLRVAAAAEPFDPKRVRGAFAELQRSRQRLEQERFEMLLKVRETLTGEQWQRLTRFVELMRREGIAGEDPEVRGVPRRPLRPRF